MLATVRTNLVKVRLRLSTCMLTYTAGACVPCEWRASSGAAARGDDTTADSARITSDTSP